MAAALSLECSVPFCPPPPSFPLSSGPEGGEQPSGAEGQCPQLGSRQPGLREVPPCRVQCIGPGPRGRVSGCRGPHSWGGRGWRQHRQRISVVFVLFPVPRGATATWEPFAGRFAHHEYSSSCSVARTAVAVILSSSTSQGRCLAQSLVVVLSHPAGD